MDKFVGIYLIMGLITCVIGGYRSWKYSIESDELSAIAWFLCWWIYLPYFLLRVTYLKLRNTYDKKWN